MFLNLTIIYLILGFTSAVTAAPLSSNSHSLRDSTSEVVKRDISFNFRFLNPNPNPKNHAPASNEAKASLAVQMIERLCEGRAIRKDRKEFPFIGDPLGTFEIEITSSVKIGSIRGPCKVKFMSELNESGKWQTQAKISGNDQRGLQLVQIIKDSDDIVQASKSNLGLGAAPASASGFRPGDSPSTSRSGNTTASSGGYVVAGNVTTQFSRDGTFNSSITGMRLSGASFEHNTTIIDGHVQTTNRTYRN